eukprot:scaffold470_cov257-Pinguiococcus_pyrenoidosus.AAC.20
MYSIGLRTVERFAPPLTTGRKEPGVEHDRRALLRLCCEHVAHPTTILDDRVVVQPDFGGPFLEAVAVGLDLLRCPR